MQNCIQARIFSSHMREKMQGTHMSKFHAPTPLIVLKKVRTNPKI